MRVSEADLLILPGLGGAGEGHWLTRWGSRLSTARRVEQDWGKPLLAAWTDRLGREVAAAERPVVIVAQGLGCLAIAHAGAALSGKVRGAFLVGPTGAERVRALSPKVDPAFAGAPDDPLPFPSLLVASRNDPDAPFEEASDRAYAWGSAFVDAGEAGQIDETSGHGPWPEGLMRLAGFLARL